VYTTPERFKDNSPSDSRDRAAFPLDRDAATLALRANHRSTPMNSVIVASNRMRDRFEFVDDHEVSLPIIWAREFRPPHATI
jgi:hypothetical protein